MTTDTTTPDVAGLIERLESHIHALESGGCCDLAFNDDAGVMRHAVALVRTLSDKLASVEEEAEKVCDSYAAENQRLYDRAEAAEATLAALSAQEAGAECPVCYGKEVTFYTSDNCPECSPSAQIRAINEMLDAGQGDDDGPQILPDFEPGMSVVAKVEACLHLLEKRRDVIEAPATPPPAQEAGAEPVPREFWLHYDHQAGRWCVEQSPPKVIRTGAEVIHTREVRPSLDRRGEWEPVAFAETLNFYISDSENGVCRVPRQKLVEVQDALRSAASPSHQENGR